MHEVPPPTSDLALWRYGLISALLHRDPGGNTLGEMLDELARPEYRDPLGRLRRLSPETLRKWLTRYRIGGLAALDDQTRSDKGRSRVPTALVEAICALRQQHPRWTLALIFGRLAEDGLWNGYCPSLASLYRFCCRAGLERKGPDGPARRSFAFDEFGGLWIADFLHGPRLNIGQQKRKTYLHLILDDATRFIVGAGFFLHENVDVLIGELRHAIRRHGIPQRFYSDNGAAYRSRHLRIVGARLQMQMPHTPPYQPQGRGKIERIFRTLREQFLEATEAKTLVDLQQGLQLWIARYHETPHESLGCTPLQKRAVVGSVCRCLPEATPIEPLFFMERRCRVYNDGTIRLRRRAFEVPEAQPGGRILAYYDPTAPHRVWYGETMHLARPLDRHRNALRFHQPPTRKEQL